MTEIYKQTANKYKYIISYSSEYIYSLIEIEIRKIDKSNAKGSKGKGNWKIKGKRDFGDGKDKKEVGKEWKLSIIISGDETKT